MANLDYTLPTPAGGVSTAADANPHTILQWLMPANQRGILYSFEIGFRGISVTGTPLQVRVLRQSTAGTGGTSLTPANTNSVAETIQATALRGAFSAEPTLTAALWTVFCQPQLSTGKAFTFSREFVNPGGGRLAIEVTDSSSAGCVANATMFCTE